LAIRAARDGSPSVAEMLIMLASCSTDDSTLPAKSSPSSIPGTRCAARSSTSWDVSSVSVVANRRWVEASSGSPKGEVVCSKTKRAVAV
jgi:hypothetical protein